MRLARLAVVLVVVLLLSTPIQPKTILQSVLTDFDAQINELYLLTMVTNEGPSVSWYLHDAPVCGNVYLMTSEMESNGGNPCDSDGNCDTPLSSGTNLTDSMSLDLPYLVYLFTDEDCTFGEVDEILFEEYSIPENITLNVPLTQNENSGPVAYGQTVRMDGGTTELITLTGSIDVSSHDNYTVTITHFDDAIGELTDSGGTDVVIGEAMSDPDLLFTPTTQMYSTAGMPLGSFEFFMTGDSGLQSEAAEVPIFVEYTGTSPIVLDRDVQFKTQFDNGFTPVEVETDAAKPTEFFLEALPPLADCEVYQSSNGIRIGSVITTVPTRINDDLIFYFSSASPTSGTFSYSATNADGNSSPDAVVSYETFASSSFPEILRCIVNVAQQSSTVIDLANTNCVNPTSSVDMEDLAFYVLEPPQNGKLYHWEDGEKGDQIFSTDTNVLVEDGQVLFEITDDTVTPQFAEIRYTASETDEFGNPSSEFLVINIVENTPPFIPEGSVDVTTDEDVPVTLELTGTDLERTLLRSYVNTLPTRGTLYQYDDTQTDNQGDAIVANANGVFTETYITDTQNRVVFSPSLNENGNPYTTFTYLVTDGLNRSNLGIGSIAVDPVPDDPISSSSFYTVEEVSKTIIQLDGYDPESEDNALLTYELLTIPFSSTYGDIYSGQLFQTDQFENYDADEPILDVPVNVSDSLGRLVYVAADVPVQFTSNGSQFFLQVDFDFRAVVPATDTTARQESDISTVTIDVLGVNNPPFTQSQSVVTVEDTPVSITLEGTDNDQEDQDDLIVYISEVPQYGVLSQWVDMTETQQFEIIQTTGISVSDSQQRVIYIPDQDQVGDPLDTFSFVYFDGKETSFSSEVTITVLCDNDAPELGDLPENVKAEDGTDIVIYLGGTDVDSGDPLGYCFGDMANFEAVISSVPNSVVDFSLLFQYIDPDDQGLTDTDRQGDLRQFDPVTGLETYADGTVPLKKTRGDPIDVDGTAVTDPLRRIIFAANFSGSEGANSSVSHFSYYFRDSDASSVETDLDVEVRVLSGVDPDSYGDSWRGYISYLAGVGLSALILLCVCIVLSLMARKPQIEENDEGWVEFVPDRDEGYEQELEEDDDDVIEKPKSPLEELLLQENARVVTTLCDIVEVTEFDEVAGALVAIFEFHNQTLELIKKLITKEVHEAHSAGTLFRSNSIASKVMTAYSKKIGQDYLEATLITPITHILDKDFSFEVDPRKLGPGEDRKQNMKLLLKACENFFDWITTSGNNAPPQFKTICYHLFNEVNEKFPQNRHSAVGGFLFLRFFCPAIISPDGHGIKPETSISVRSRRCFVLVAKVLQNLSNGLLFGQKENFMLEVNGFIEGHKTEIITFFEDMSRDEMVGKGRAAFVDTMELEEALNTTHRHLYLNIEEMEEVLNQRQNTEGTVQSEIASKITDGLTTFLHTQSHLDTSDISGLTAARTRGGATTKSRAGTHNKSDTWLDWVQDSDKTDHDFTFEGGGSDLEGSSIVDTENIELVPFNLGGDEDEITDFDLSSHVPDSSESGMDEHTSLVSTAMNTEGSSAMTASNKTKSRGRRGNKRWSHRRMSRRSQMTMTGTDMSVISTYDHRRRTSQKSGAMTDQGEYGYGFGEGDFDDVDREMGGEVDEGQRVALDLLKVLDDLGTPPGL